MAHTEAWIFFIHAEYLQTLQALGTAVHCFYVNINKETGRWETKQSSYARITSNTGKLQILSTKPHVQCTEAAVREASIHPFLLSFWQLAWLGSRQSPSVLMSAQMVVSPLLPAAGSDSFL